MQVETYTQARGKLAQLLKTVNQNKSEVHITQKDGNDAVLISKSEYDGLKETLHLLSTPANASRLLKSISDAKSGSLESHNLVDPDETSLD